MTEHQQIILVDDDRFFNQVASLLIKKVVPTAFVKTFDKPAAALQFIDSSKTGLSSSCVLFIDVNMPETSGWELLDQLAELPIHKLQCLEIYMISALANEADARKAQKHPLVQGYFSKPITVQTIKNIIRVVSAPHAMAV